MKSILTIASLLLIGLPRLSQAQTERLGIDTTYDGKPLGYWIRELRSASAPQSRNAAAYAISGMGPAAISAVPALIEALSDPASSVRYPVCVALREIGPGAAAAVPELQKLLDDPSDDVAFMARLALRRITGKNPES
jgi:HEAT repeat protein